MGKHASVKVRLIRNLSNYGQPDKCWEWQGHKRANTGYGRMGTTSGKSDYTHRVAYVELGGGKLNPDLEIRHLCGNGSCCNPAHLKQGTHSENMHDSVKAGTHYSYFREKPKPRKIDHEAVVSEFVREYEFVERSQRGRSWRSNARELAEKYNTKESYILKLVRKYSADSKQDTHSKNVQSQAKPKAALGPKRKINHEDVVSDFVRKYEFIKRPQGGGSWRSNARELAEKYNTKETYIKKIIRKSSVIE